MAKMEKLFSTSIASCACVCVWCRRVLCRWKTILSRSAIFSSVYVANNVISCSAVVVVQLVGCSPHHNEKQLFSQDRIGMAQLCRRYTDTIIKSTDSSAIRNHRQQCLLPLHYVKDDFLKEVNRENSRKVSMRQGKKSTSWGRGGGGVVWLNKA